jgi:hypothetical protein
MKDETWFVLGIGGILLGMFLAVSNNWNDCGWCKKPQDQYYTSSLR